MKKYILLSICLAVVLSARAQTFYHSYHLPWARLSPSVNYVPAPAIPYTAGIFKDSKAELKTSTHFNWDQNANTWGDTQNNVIFSWLQGTLNTSVNNYYSFGKIFSRDLNSAYTPTSDHGTELDGYLAVSALHQTLYADTNWVNDQLQTTAFDKESYISTILYQRYYLDTLRNQNQMVYLRDAHNHYNGWVYHQWNENTTKWDTAKGWYQKFEYNYLGDITEAHVYSSDWQHPGTWIVTDEKYDLNPDGSIKLMRIYDSKGALTDSVVLNWNSYNKAFIDHYGEYSPAAGGDKQDLIRWYNKDQSGNWTLTQSLDAKYDANGNVLNKAGFYNDNGTRTDYKYTYAYGTDGVKMLEVDSVLQSGTWHESYRYDLSRVYDTNNKLVSESFTEKDNGVITNGSKYEYTYEVETSIAPVAQSHISLFPNPAVNSVCYMIPGTSGNARISVCDVTGRVLKTEIQNTAQGSIDLSACQPGTYFILIHTGNASYSARVIKGN
jgi:hypothetical protein